MLPYLLALGLGLVPSAPPESIRSVAAAITSVTDDREDAVTLMVIDAALGGGWHGTRAFGLDWAARPRASMHDMALVALSVLHTARARCGGELERSLGYFETGTCRVTRKAAWETRTIRRVLSVAP